MLEDAETRADLAGRERVTIGRGVTQFEECIRAGGIVLFPADTVYGLAVDPRNEDAIERMYALKGRPREKKSALMYFLVDAVPDLPERARRGSCPAPSP